MISKCVIEARRERVLSHRLAAAPTIDTNVKIEI